MYLYYNVHQNIIFMETCFWQLIKSQQFGQWAEGRGEGAVFLYDRQLWLYLYLRLPPAATGIIFLDCRPLLLRQPSITSF